MTLAPAGAKSERLINLLIMLLVQRHYVAKEKIRSILYPGMGDEAFEKMFERDKEELRSLGVPIEVGSMDAFFEEPGYRIRRDQFELPEVRLEPDEAAVVSVAAKVWEHARLAGATAEALRKLKASGQELDESALEIAQAHLMAEEPSFDALWEATCDRVEVRFTYRRPGGEESIRTVQPWGVVRHSGRWYLVGWDADRGEERIFRLSRVQGAVRRQGKPGAYRIPAGVDVRAVAQRLAGPRTELPLTVLVRQGSGYGLRRGAQSVETGVAGPDGTHEWDRVELTRNANPIAELLSYGADVVVLAPAEIRREVRGRLEALSEVDRPGSNVSGAGS